jgi:hypothetical protein
VARVRMIEGVCERIHVSRARSGPPSARASAHALPILLPCFRGLLADLSPPTSHAPFTSLASKRRCSRALSWLAALLLQGESGRRVRTCAKERTRAPIPHSCTGVDPCLTHTSPLLLLSFVLLALLGSLLLLLRVRPWCFRARARVPLARGPHSRFSSSPCAHMSEGEHYRLAFDPINSKVFECVY